MATAERNGSPTTKYTAIVATSSRMKSRSSPRPKAHSPTQAMPINAIAISMAITRGYQMPAPRRNVIAKPTPSNGSMTPSRAASGSAARISGITKRSVWMTARASVARIARLKRR